MKGTFGESVIHVKRADLLARITENRAKHRAEFERAMKGYEAAVRQWFEKRLAEIREGKDYFTTSFGGPVPQDHTDDYDRVIDMLHMEIRDELEIDEQQFRMYVRDDWQWKQLFTVSNSGYLAR